jgi:hypothetical protein
MKSRKSLILLVGIALLIALSACSVTDPVVATPSPSPSASPSTPPVIAKSIKVYDANDVFLGYCTKSDETGLTIYSPASYFYSMQWDGQVKDTACYYTEENGAGDPFYLVPYAYELVLQSKTVIRAGNNYYTFKNSNPNGTTTNDDSFPTYHSIYNYITGAIINYPAGETVNYGAFCACALKVADKLTVGIPESIATPLKLSFTD